MEISSLGGLSELVMGGQNHEHNHHHHQWEMSSLDDLYAFPVTSGAIGGTLHHCISTPYFNVDAKTSAENSMEKDTGSRPTKQMKSSSWGSCEKTADQMSNPHSSSPSSLLSFTTNSNASSTVIPKSEALSPQNLTFYSAPPFNRTRPSKLCSTNKGIGTTTRISQAQDHIIAERRRREKLSQRFIALSSLVPGLKKMDKASVLGDAIKYLKQLQEQVKKLEEQTKKKTMECVFIKRSEVSVVGDGENSSSDDDDGVSSGRRTGEQPLPEIEVKLLERDVLIRIHCEKRKGVIEKIVAEVEKLHLVITNTSAMTFAISALDLTVIAQMDVEFKRTARDIVKDLHSAFKLFM